MRCWTRVGAAWGCRQHLEPFPFVRNSFPGRGKSRTLGFSHIPRRNGGTAMDIALPAYVEWVILAFSLSNILLCAAFQKHNRGKSVRSVPRFAVAPRVPVQQRNP